MYLKTSFQKCSSIWTNACHVTEQMVAKIKAPFAQGEWIIMTESSYPNHVGVSKGRGLTQAVFSLRYLLIICDPFQHSLLALQMALQWYQQHFLFKRNICLCCGISVNSRCRGGKYRKQQQLCRRGKRGRRLKCGLAGISRHEDWLAQRDACQLQEKWPAMKPAC